MNTICYSKIGDLEYDVEGVPLCPLDGTPFKSEGPYKGKCYHTCENPCTDKKSGRMTYVYPDKDFRLYPGVQRNSKEWDDEYPNRACIERTLSSFKSNPCIESPRTLSTATMGANLCLTAISKLVNVILAYAIKNQNTLEA